LFPVAFKIVDLISPFRGRTVATLLGVWLIAVVCYFVWRSRRKGTLAEAAADVDGRAALADELKTAYWFINNPRASEWVDLQIRRAAKRVSELNVNRLYPRSIPRTSYVALGLFAVWVLLNFAPLSWNNNWLLLQAAPAFDLTDAERNLLSRAEESLRNTEMAERVQEIMQQLQEGVITPAEAMDQLAALQEELGQEDVDAEAIDAALNQVADALSGSEELEEIAQALRDMDLADASELLNELAENATPEQMQGMQQSLQEAAESAQKTLDDLAEDLKDASDSIAQQDPEGARQALADAAQFLEDLANQIENQELSQQAADQLKQFQQSLQERLQSENQPQPPSGEPQEGQSTEGGQPQPGGGTPTAQAASAGQQEGDPQQASEGGNQDTGQNPSGMPGETKNQPPVQLELDVQLEQAALTGLHDEAVEQEKIEETSKQERSRLDYRNVESELTPAQKDLLNQEQIPWEYRDLIRNYFEAIRPPQEKQQ
jgi:hypothetical protein